MDQFFTLLAFVAVGALWGLTNPLLNRASGDDGNDSEKPKTPVLNRFVAFWQDLVALLLNWKFLLPFLLNQGGSVLYVAVASQTDISLAQPICNSLGTLFTAIASRLLGERSLHTYSIVGIICVLTGVTKGALLSRGRCETEYQTLRQSIRVPIDKREYSLERS